MKVADGRCCGVVQAAFVIWYYREGDNSGTLDEYDMVWTVGAPLAFFGLLMICLAIYKWQDDEWGFWGRTEVLTGSHIESELTNCGAADRMTGAQRLGFASGWCAS